MTHLLDPTYIRDNVDYSFGDQSGSHLFNGYMKLANNQNLEFLNLCEKIKKERNWMTVFIDNFRLYRRPNIRYTNLEMSNEGAREFKLNKIAEFSNQDLLALLKQIPGINFLVFTGFEDTPIDDDIFDIIPENVLKIYASNCQSFGGKVIPIPYGIQRKLNFNDNRHDIILSFIDSDIQPSKLLYVNHSLGTNPERIKITSLFENKNWVTKESPNSIKSDHYSDYLTKIKQHKFMICPEGNAPGCECSRDWEVIYMRRVPVVQETKYLKRIFEGIPVLFVNSFSEVTEELLIQNNYLWEEIQSFDLSKLSYKKIFEEILKSNLS